MEKTENRRENERGSKRGALHRIDRRTFENLPGDVREKPGAKAMFLAYFQKGPCTTKDAIEYALRLPEKPKMGTLKKYDAMLKRCGAIIRAGTPTVSDPSPAQPGPRMDWTPENRGWDSPSVARKKAWTKKVKWAARKLDEGGDPQRLVLYLLKEYPGRADNPLPVIRFIGDTMGVTITRDKNGVHTTTNFPATMPQIGEVKGETVRRRPNDR